MLNELLIENSTGALIARTRCWCVFVDTCPHLVACLRRAWRICRRRAFDTSHLVMLSTVIGLIACGSEQSAGTDARFSVAEPPALAGITQAHNEVRSGVGVAALVWDPALAQVAQAWAEACVDNDAPSGLIDHNSGRSDTYPGYVGENIYGSSGTADPIQAVTAWADEVADYDYATNSCTAGRVCGHYTQVVWRTSTKLGCGVATCAGLRFGSSVVCNYSPGGNNGDRPY